MKTQVKPVCIVCGRQLEDGEKVLFVSHAVLTATPCYGSTPRNGALRVKLTSGGRRGPMCKCHTPGKEGY